MAFEAVGTAAAPAAWDVAENWEDLTNPLNVHVPNSSDDVSIPGGVGYVSLASGETEEINSIVTASGSVLIVPTRSPQQITELKIDSNPPTDPPEGLVSPVPGSNYFGGAVIDAGLINANTTRGGTNIIFAGGADIGPGDLNGNLVAGPSSSITFTGGGAGAANTFESGATFGQGAGDIHIAGTVSVMGTLDDKTATLDIDPGGTLGGPGSLDDWANVNWTGGTISLTGGVTVYTTFTASGPATLALGTTLTNEETTDLTGAGVLAEGTTGSIDNAAGTLTLGQSVTGMPGMGAPVSVTNSALGILDVSAPSSAPLTISVPFTNDGNLNVDSGSSLDLTSPVVGGAPTIDLNGNLGLDGNLYLYSTATSSSGFTLGSGSGYFEVGGVPGSGNPSGTLMVPSGVSDHIQGNLEINGNSTLTGGGTVYNSGLLQLDTGSSTAGLGAYVQSNSGTLAEVVGAMGMFTPLRVTGMAQLSGTLTLPGYVPKVGSKFTVVIAGQLEDHFDSIPDGMVETDGPNTSTVTQVNPPA